MPVEIKITLDKKKLSQSLLTLGRKGTRSAASAAINKTIRGARTDATNLLHEETQARTKKVVRENIKLKTASRRILSARIEVLPRGIPLSKIKSAKLKRGRGGGVLYRNHQIKRSFKSDKITGSRDFFIRTTDKRYPIKRAYGYTLTQEYKHNKVYVDLERKASKRFTVEWERAFSRELSRAGF